jgi:hypothetical protein
VLAIQFRNGSAHNPEHRLLQPFNASIVVRVSLPAATARLTTSVELLSWLPISRIPAAPSDAGL